MQHVVILGTCLLCFCRFFDHFVVELFVGLLGCWLLPCCSVALLFCWLAGLLVCWFVVVCWTLGCWLVSCLIELSLLLCGVSDPAIPGTVAEWPAGQLDPAPPKGAAMLDH